MAGGDGGARRCLVTGASGPVGSALVRKLLAEGREVAAMVQPSSSRSRLEGVEKDVEWIEATLDSVERAGPAIRRFAADTVFHLAWQGSDRASRNGPAQISTNVTGTLKLLEMVLDAGAQCWVGVGSRAEYGPQTGRLEETMTPVPADSYGLAKLCVGELSRARCERAGVRSVWLRLLATYGPADDDRRFIPYAIQALLAGETPRLTSGTQKWDYLYTGDAVEAMIAAANSAASGVFNLASGTAWTIREIAEFLRAEIAPEASLEFGADAPRSLEADISRIAAATGWRPRIPMEEGLRQTVEWYRARRRAGSKAIAVGAGTEAPAVERSAQEAMKGSDYVARFLEEQGVAVVFELSGGMITHMLDSISRRGKIRIVSVHHEQAAAFAADAMGRLTGTPGVAMATSGPGATNLLTGIASCYFDSSPAVFLTGQVNRNEQKGERPIRQLGFQETEILPIARPVTKSASQARVSEDLPRLLEAAFAVAVTGRPGPALVDIPMDLQRMGAVFPEPKLVRCRRDTARIESDYLREMLAALRKAARPLLLAGGGIRAARATDLLRKFARLMRVPVVKSLLALDAMPYADPLQVGMIGTYGNRWANLAVGRSDLLLVLGSRLDVRQTGADAIAFGAGRTIFHVDCDAGELNNRVTGCRTAECDVKEFLAAAIAAVAETETRCGDEGWIEEIQALRAKWPDTAEIKGISGINPNVFMHQLSQAFTGAGTYVADVGQHQMWAGQSLELGETQRFLTSGGMGSMGFGLPAAIGAAFVDSSKPVVLIAGDGGFQCNIQELQTVVRNQLPVKMVVMDNGCHGMVRQFQESYFEANYQSTLRGYSAPDFTSVAEAYGIRARMLKDPVEASAAIEWLHSTENRPALLQVKIDTFANAYPKIAYGRPMTEMEPLATPLEQEGT